MTKDINSAELATVIGGGWTTNFSIGGLCLASGPIGTLLCVGAYNGYKDSARQDERRQQQ